MNKILLLGDLAVGKTSIMTKLTKDDFEIKQSPTNVVNFENYEVDDMTFQFIDTSGNSRFSMMISTFYKNSDTILYVYDISDLNSFNNIIRVISNTVDACSRKILVGNKLDMNRKVDYFDGVRLAGENGMHFIEVSSKTGENLDSLKKNIYEDYKRKNFCVSIIEKTKNAFYAFCRP